MAKIGILFEIGELGGGLYGYKAYTLLFNIIKPNGLAGITFSDGDTRQTLQGSADQYCISLEGDNPRQLARISEIVLGDNSQGLSPAGQRILDEDRVNQEPLVPAMILGRNREVLACNTGWVREAWEKAIASQPAEDEPKIKRRTQPKAEKVIESIQLFEPASLLAQRRKTAWIGALASIPIVLFAGTVLLAYLVDTLAPGNPEAALNTAFPIAAVLAVIIFLLVLASGYRKTTLLIDKNGIARDTVYWGNRKRRWFLPWERMLNVTLDAAYIRIETQRDIKVINHKNFAGGERYRDFEKFFGLMVKAYKQDL